jgi:hypothetical protein
MNPVLGHCLIDTETAVVDTAYYTFIQGSKKRRKTVRRSTFCKIRRIIFECKLLIYEDELHCLSREMFRVCEAFLEAGDFSEIR